MSPIDVGVILLYITGCTALGAWLGSRAQGLKGYFLGESNIPAWAVMISIVATETSVATFLSVPGVAYKGDFTYLQLAIGYLFGRMIVATVLLPAYFRGEIFTAYQILQSRFGGPTRTTASVLFLVTRSLADGLRLFLAAKVLQQLTGWPIAGAIVVVGIATVVYTFLGGMKAVIWTDVIQFTIYITGALISLAILASKLPGGFPALWQTAESAGKLRMFDFSFDLTKPFTFWAGLFGGMVLNTATHGADQMMVQRYLSARSQRQAAGALVASGLVIFAQFALFLFIGVSLWVFYQQFPPTFAGSAIASATAGTDDLFSSLVSGRSARTFTPDDVFAYFVVHYLPTGLLGLVIAAIFSAAMGTLAGSLNSSASTIVNDLYRPLTGQNDEVKLLRLSRGLTVVWGLILMLVAVGATQLKDNVVNNALAIASFTTGILLGLFLLGILTKSVGQSAALTGMLAGVAAVSFAKFGTPLAWPWYALVGSSTVFLVGLAASRVLPIAPAASSKPPGLEPDL
jgi:SSS family solute:Na+ symporter